MLCDRLRECRRKCGLSQQQVAAELNVDRATYSYYESGRTQPSLENLKKIAEIFGVHLYELLEIGEPAPPVFRDAGAPGFGGPFISPITSEPFLGRLTKDEQELIIRFRKLSPLDRAKLLGSICSGDITFGKEEKNTDSSSEN